MRLYSISHSNMPVLMAKAAIQLIRQKMTLISHYDLQISSYNLCAEIQHISAGYICSSLEHFISLTRHNQ